MLTGVREGLESAVGSAVMNLILFAAGVALILAGLWNRDEERLALGLFAAGAVLVLAAGLLLLRSFDPTG